MTVDDVWTLAFIAIFVAIIVNALIVLMAWIRRR